ncbi:MAG: hypothetical protein KF819_35755 [Labilithrix sp.]|nr:hypothetical protein [Labilithrix sp.]
MNRTNMRALARLAPLLAPLVVVACKDDPVPVNPPGVTDVDGGGTSSCAPPTGAGTTHDTAPSIDETWTAAASPHVVSGSLSLPAGRTITIEPCAVVQMKSGASMIVEGKLLALGAEDKRIRFERGDANAPWKTIEARKGAELRFAYTLIDGGGKLDGSSPTGVGALDIRGDQDSATQPILFVDSVVVRGSESLGILVREGGGFAPGSKDLAITAGASFPISIWGRAAGSLPSGSYGGNAVDEIILPAMGGRDDVKEDTKLANLGVPFRVGGPTGGKSLTVAGTGSVPLLTIAAGVKLRFDKDVRLDIEANSDVAAGALRVEGAAGDPVVFESAAATPAAGDWVGIVIEGKPDARNSIAHAVIRYAGGASQISSFDCPSPLNSGFGNEGAIVIAGGQPGSAFVTNTTIESSAGDGIVRGWTGAPVDMLPTNTFTNVARCNQTYPKPQAGSCPDPAPCPK